jgi:hypothetical protein
MMHDVV